MKTKGAKKREVQARHKFLSIAKKIAKQSDAINELHNGIQALKVKYGEDFPEEFQVKYKGKNQSIADLRIELDELRQKNTKLHSESKAAKREMNGKPKRVQNATYT